MTAFFRRVMSWGRMLVPAPVTPGMREVLKLSKAEAGRLDHDYVGPEHLLLGILRKREGLAVDMLERIGVHLEVILSEVEQHLRNNPPPRKNLFTYDADAKRVLACARSIAKHEGHPVSTDCLLVAITKAEDTDAAIILRRAGVTPATVLISPSTSRLQSSSGILPEADGNNSNI